MSGGGQKRAREDPSPDDDSSTPPDAKRAIAIREIFDKVSVWFRVGGTLPLKEQLVDDMWAAIVTHLPPAALGPLLTALRHQYPSHSFVTGEKEWDRYFAGLRKALWRRMIQRDFTSPFEINWKLPSMAVFIDVILAKYEGDEDPRYDDLAELSYAAISWARCIMVLGCANAINPTSPHQTFSIDIPPPSELYYDFWAVVNGPDAPRVETPEFDTQKKPLIDRFGSLNVISQPIFARNILRPGFEGQAVTESYIDEVFLFDAADHPPDYLESYVHRYSSWDVEGVKEMLALHPSIQPMIDAMKTAGSYVNKSKRPLSPTLHYIEREATDDNLVLNSIKTRFKWWGSPGTQQTMIPRPVIRLQRRFLVRTNDGVTLIDGFTLSMLSSDSGIQIRMATGILSIDVDQFLRAGGSTAYDVLKELSKHTSATKIPELYYGRMRTLLSARGLFETGEPSESVLLATFVFGLAPTYDEVLAKQWMDIVLSPSGRQELQFLGNGKLTMFAGAVGVGV